MAPDSQDVSRVYFHVPHELSKGELLCIAKHPLVGQFRLNASIGVHGISILLPNVVLLTKSRIISASFSRILFQFLDPVNPNWVRIEHESISRMNPMSTIIKIGAAAIEVPSGSKLPVTCLSEGKPERMQLVQTALEKSRFSLWKEETRELRTLPTLRSSDTHFVCSPH